MKLNKPELEKAKELLNKLIKIYEKGVKLYRNLIKQLKDDKE